MILSCCQSRSGVHVIDRCHTLIDSPIGPLTLVATGASLSGLYMDRHQHGPGGEVLGRRADAPVLSAAAEQLAEYFDGQRRHFELPLAPEGSPFQQAVWMALRDIPYASTESYGELAARIGRPGAARAVGLANGRNPISIIVPCHRVIGADGSLTGYGGGVDRKRHLLDLERATAGCGPATLFA
jgi:methylated-DNA-[protein]-cysteine S-methyltransferase